MTPRTEYAYKQQSSQLCKPVESQRPASARPDGGRGVARGMCIAAPIGLCQPVRDCTLIQTMLTGKGVAMERTFVCNRRGSTSKHELLNVLADFLLREAAVHVVYYSGHGDQGEEGQKLGGLTGGALMVGCPDVVGSTDALVTLDDLMHVWDVARGRRRGGKLLLVIDACYSGKLVTKLRNLPKGVQDTLNIAIQAAGNARQGVAESDGGAGNRHAGTEFSAGFFTSYWASRQGESRVRWSVPKQHPQFYATWDYSSCDRASFDVPLGQGQRLVMYSQPDNR
jgi:hypothetical protein